jgi:response regulator NasT
MTRPLRIAVAEDEQATRDYYQEVLPRLGHQVVAVAEDGRRLVELCRRAAPDLVITDIRMPGMDGIAAAEEVCRGRPVPVVLVSAYDEEALARVAADHVMAYLVKPVGEDDLRAAIAVALARFAHFQALAKAAADLRQALEDRKLIERAKGILMKRLRVDEEDAFRRLRSFAAGQNLKLAEAGRRILAAEEVFSQVDKL